ncbi:recombinase family protein [Phytohabitans sp. ZYX-F-186]|uniref:Recombinase family protein n=1 Tax=Phytohabitans maris TaxID=3071409 RepID=A0ABU0ZG17_9ACTN|nr:recombinase family protein [Phytohabitans sp. ZYX-F-186]MDQ7905933.1 recombinase family protein [Phytohabitans sp. ZYX-F-186]
MNFAFYGQAVTTDRQQARTIQARQVADATARVASLGGHIVREFFDIYPDRHRAWRHRRQAARLLAAFTDPGRGFDAVVVSDTRSAFSPYQYDLVLSLCTRHGVQLWLPEIDGPVASNNAGHDRIMMELFWRTVPPPLLGPAAETAVAAARTAELSSWIDDVHILHEQPFPRAGRAGPARAVRRRRVAVSSRGRTPASASARHRGRNMKFAFYGRVSTEDQQDPEASRAWQLSRSRALIEPAGGQIVAEFFDIGLSRSLPWKRRPQAARLLAALRDPNRGFEAVVIGEPQRAFYGNQFGLTFPLSSTTASHFGRRRSVAPSTPAATPMT